MVDSHDWFKTMKRMLDLRIVFDSKRILNSSVAAGNYSTDTPAAPAILLNIQYIQDISVSNMQFRVRFFVSII